MMPTVHIRVVSSDQRGFGLVETMVGILVGLMVVLVIYNLLSAAEGYKRMTVGASDAQVTGLFSQFVVARDAGNGGNGFSLAADELVNCTVNEAGAPDWTLRPFAVLLTDKGSPDGESESFIAMASGAPRVLWPVDFTIKDALPGNDFVVQTPNAFSSPVPAVEPYRAIVMAKDGTGRCTMTRITGAGAPDGFGNVALQHDPVTITYKKGVARLMNLGPAARATRIQYDVGNAQLRSTDLYAGAQANPVAQNIVLMKAQYGVDSNGDQRVDCWTAAATPAVSGDPCANGVDYSDTALRALPPPALLAAVNSILAVRVAVVVRSDEPDVKDPGLVAANGRPSVFLFNCAANDNTCQSRIELKPGVCPPPYYSPPTICDRIRYRVYETVIPLRNALFASTIGP